MLKIAVDFDGTLCEHRYPKIGKELPLAIETLIWIQKNLEAQIFLDTMRSEKELQEAINWCRERGLEFNGIGKDPQQQRWTDSNKCYAHLSIDDRNVGVPLMMDSSGRHCVDWEELIPILSERIDKNLC